MGLDLAWSSAVLRVLRDHHSEPTSLQDIYIEVWRYRQGRDSDFEYTRWDEPRYQHLVRGVLQLLKRRGFVENIRRGMWALRLEEAVKEQEMGEEGVNLNEEG